ncbi:MAG: sugar phosphate isomerase/epimerase family protein [Promethearchaeota archaeon]
MNHGKNRRKVIPVRFSTTITNPSIIHEPLDEIIDTLIDANFDAVDIPGEPAIFPIEKVKSTLESRSNKITIGELTACINPNRDLISPMKTKRHHAINYIKYCINAASELGCNLTHLCFITSKENLNKTPRDILEKRAIDTIRELHLYAEDLGVKLLIEPLYKQDISPINRAIDAARLYARALDEDLETFLGENDNHGLLLDIFHMHHEEENLLDTLQQFHHVTFHVHVADHLRGLDFDREDSGFACKAVQKLKELDYQHLISFESFETRHNLKSLKRALSSLKKCSFTQSPKIC